MPAPKTKVLTLAFAALLVVGTLDSAAALAYMDALLKRDEAMTTLRRKWLPEFQKVVPAATAVRVIQIDRRLSNAMQVMLSSQIPLVH